MATERMTVMKEFHKLLRTADKLYDSQVEFVLEHGENIDTEEVNYEEDDSDRYLEVFFFVTPKDGLYKNARVKFKMRIEVTEYPSTPPEATCCNQIYHPNIDYINEYESDASICVNLLSSDWEPEVGLDGTVMAVLFLFHNPQLDDALSPVVGSDNDYNEFVINVKQSLRGESVNDNTFDRLILEELDTKDEKNEYNAAKTTMTADTVIIATDSDFTGTKKLDGAGVNADENILMIEDARKEDMNLPEEIENKESKPEESDITISPEEENVGTTPENEHVSDDSKPLSSTETPQHRVATSATKLGEFSTQSTVDTPSVTENTRTSANASKNVFQLGYVKFKVCASRLHKLFMKRS